MRLSVGWGMKNPMALHVLKSRTGIYSNSLGQISLISVTFQLHSRYPSASPMEVDAFQSCCVHHSTNYCRKK